MRPRLHARSARHARPPRSSSIEDAHWADQLTLDVLRVLARRVEAGAARRRRDIPRTTSCARGDPLRTLVGRPRSFPSVSRVEPRRLSLGRGRRADGWPQERCPQGLRADGRQSVPRRRAAGERGCGAADLGPRDDARTRLAAHARREVSARGCRCDRRPGRSGAPPTRPALPCRCDRGVHRQRHPRRRRAVAHLPARADPQSRRGRHSGDPPSGAARRARRSPRRGGAAARRRAHRAPRDALGADPMRCGSMRGRQAIARSLPGAPYEAGAYFDLALAHAAGRPPAERAALLTASGTAHWLGGRETEKARTSCERQQRCTSSWATWSGRGGRSAISPVRAGSSIAGTRPTPPRRPRSRCSSAAATSRELALALRLENRAPTRSVMTPAVCARSRLARSPQRARQALPKRPRGRHQHRPAGRMEGDATAPQAFERAFDEARAAATCTSRSARS